MIHVHTIVVSEFSQNCRLLIDSDSSDLFIIDPGSECDRILSILNQLNQRYSFHKITIILTHLHIDHVGAVDQLKKKLEENIAFEVKLLFHKEADEFRNTIKLQANIFGLPVSAYDDVPEANSFIKEGETLNLGSFSVSILDTPGHAKGHISLFFSVEEFYEDEILISAPFLIGGDTLFQGSIGRTDLPGGDHQELLSSIKEKILVLPPETVVLSGHGPNTTVGYEKEHNYFLNQED